MYFSIIVPVYNVEKYLPDCIDSILNQAYDDYEVILVDDGSTDTSGKICDEYKNRDKRIKTIHKKNDGQSSARNKGVGFATGKYLVFIDSDDFIQNNQFLRDIYEASRTGTDVVVYRYVKYYSDRIEDCGIQMNGIQETDKNNIIKQLVERDAFFCSCWSKCIRRELIVNNSISFDENLSCEDMDWYFNVIEYTKSIRVLDNPYICYRQREGSVTSGGYKNKVMEDFIQTLKKWQINFERKNESEREIYLSALAKLYCNMLIYYSRNMKEAEAYKKDIFSFQNLLRYRLNPRTKKFALISSIVGVKGMCKLINCFEKT